MDSDSHGIHCCYCRWVQTKSLPLKDKWRIHTISIAFLWDYCVYETKVLCFLWQSASHAEHISNNRDKKKCITHQVLRFETHWMQNTKSPISIYSPFLNQFCRASNLPLRMVSQWPCFIQDQDCNQYPISSHIHNISCKNEPPRCVSVLFGILSIWTALSSESEKMAENGLKSTIINVPKSWTSSTFKETISLCPFKICCKICKKSHTHLTLTK